MTLGGWILFGILAAIIVATGLGIAVGACSNTWPMIITLVITAALVVGLLIGMLAYFKHTESGKRSMKTWESELNEGIKRTVRVYDVEGDLIQEYSGKFDVDYDDDRIIFDDQDGKRHVIYYPTGTVIIDEID